jgi:Zn-dependent protease with chaperone function
MLSKPLNFILVYILGVLNFVIILSPLTFLIVPLFILNNDHIQKSVLSILFLSAFVISSLMLTLLAFDFLFGFSIRPFLKNCKLYNKDKKYQFFYDTFEELKYKFGKSNVKLLIKKSTEINAFALGGLGRNYIVLTEGLLLHYLTSTNSRGEFLNCIEGIIGHEMSHLINKDYLPGLLLTINGQATRMVSKIVFLIFNFFIHIFHLIPLIGSLFTAILLSLYKLFDFFINFFYKYIILNFYKFILLQISKNIEYRCDKQSAQACGGDNMALALSLLGENGYYTIFSTHPKTRERVKQVQNVQLANQIKACFINKFINAFSLLCILYITIIFGMRADLQILINDYNDFLKLVVLQIGFIKTRIQNFISAFNN